MTGTMPAAIGPVVNGPVISVIVPTRSAPPTLGRTLAHLANQTLSPTLYEVIVVTGGAVEGVWRHAPAVRAAPAGAGLALRVLSQPGPGAARRRNAGAAAARGSLLVFLDDDMVAAPGLLEAHMHAHVDVEAARVVMGYLPPQFCSNNRRDRQMTWVEVDLRDWWEDTFRAMARPDHRFRYTDLLSGNFSLPKSLFVCVGGFNTELFCREDYELGARLLAAGAVFALNMEAQAEHVDATDLARSLQRKAAEGRADIQVARLHRELGSTMTFAKAGEYMSRASHWLLAAARRYPALADIIVHLLVIALGVLERLGLHALWTRVNGGLQLHHYWRGVLSEAQNWAEVRRLAAGTPLVEAEVDLAQGTEAAQRQLAQLHAPGVRFTWHGLPLGRIPPETGAEAVGGRHLLAWMTEEGALCCASAEALFALLGGDELAHEQAAAGVAGCPTLALRPDLCTARASAEFHEFMSVDRLQPANVTEVDLGCGWAALQPLVGGTDRCEVLLRLRGRPVSWLHLAAQGTPRHLGEVVYELLAQADLRQLLEPSGSSAAPPQAQDKRLAEAPNSSMHDCSAVSVIVCTRNRPKNLAGCLAALQQQRCPPGEIIVVDNAPADERTRETAAAWSVRYVREDRAGLDFARNCGFRAAMHPIVAYVDDDARPAPDWVAVLAAAFAKNQVAAVTGNVAPAELATDAQCLFEWDYGGMRHGFERWLFRRDLLSTTELLWANLCGVGTNMAFRRQVLVELGGFDPALDVGGPAGGGGDLELFHRLVAAGYSLLYEPAAIVWHIHRRDRAGLRRQLFDNGRSFGAYLLTCTANRTAPGGQVASFALRNWLYWALLRRLVRPGWMPRALVLAELQGALVSPLAYWRAVRRIKVMK
ncbi:MAG: glycosyltransferase [Caldilineaceae bacterium]